MFKKMQMKEVTLSEYVEFVGGNKDRLWDLATFIGDKFVIKWREYEGDRVVAKATYTKSAFGGACAVRYYLI